MPKISVIIPFNNVENYIEECLDSVLTQTLDDIEIILINDASTDRTLEIVEGYLQKDSRIKLININERKGQGFARNRGIELATGEYIGFVDSDDFIEPDMFECLYNSAKSNDTDISMCQVREYDDINENYITSDYYSLSCLSAFQNDVFSAEDTKNYILDINVALWNKIYKREYLNNIGEKFPEGFIYEDLPFFFGTYLPAKRIHVVWKNLYSYRINRKNSTMQQFNNKILDRLPMVSLTYEKLKKVPYLSDLKQKIQAWIINDLFHRYSLLKENYHKEFFFLMKKVFQSLEIENPEDEYWKRVYHFQGYLLVMNNNFEDFNNKVFIEYLDIHKVEDRLHSEMIGINEIDRRFNIVYDEITKNYKYTEELVSKLSEKNSEIYNRIEEEKSNIAKETGSKISQVYDEITKNYKYTEELVSKLSEKNSEIYNRIEEEKSNIAKETGSKISQVYEEITKNYKYTEELVSDVRDINVEISEKLEDVSKKLELNRTEIYTNIENSKQEIAKETDSKISQVYEEITRNYKYTEELFSKLSEKNSEIYDRIEEEKIRLEQETDLKISQIYDEITKNYKYTEELVQRNFEKLDSEIHSDLQNNYKILNERIEEKAKYLYNDIKDLSFVVQNNFVELNKEQDKILEASKQITANIEVYKQENEEKISDLRKEYKEIISSKIKNISNNLEQFDIEVKNYIDIIQKQLETEKEQNIQNIEELKSKFNIVLEAQQKKHDEEIEILKKQMQEMEFKLREEMKSPIQKLIEKYKTKSEK